MMGLRSCMMLLLATTVSSTYFDFSYGSSLLQVGDDITKIGNHKPLYVVSSATLSDNAGFYDELAKNTGGMVLVDSNLVMTEGNIDICTCGEEDNEASFIRYILKDAADPKFAAPDTAPDTVPEHKPLPDSKRNQFYTAVGTIVKAEIEGGLLYRKANSTSEANLLNKVVVAAKAGRYDIARKSFGMYNRLRRLSSRRRRSAEGQGNPITELEAGGLTSDEINDFLGLTGGTTLSFVFDTTGSMSEEIYNCKAVSKYIATKRAEAHDSLATYVLTEFNDPGVGPSNVYNNYEEFITAVNAVSVFGGGDCPEKAMEGVLQAIANTPVDSPIFIFTDAPPNDHQLSELVTYYADEENKALYFVTNAILCDSDDGLYAYLSDFTGGISLGYSSDGSNLNELMTNLIQGSAKISVVGEDREVVAGGRRKRSTSDNQFPVVVDDSIPNLAIVVVFEQRSTGSATLLGPSGDSVKSTSTSKLTIFNIPSPPTGTYHLTINAGASSKYEYTAMTSGKLNLDFEYFFLGQVNIGKEKIDTVMKDLIPGRTYTLTMIISENVKHPSVELVAARNTGEVLVSATDIEHSTGSGMNGLSAKVTIPRSTFRIKLRGLTTNDIPFERVSKKAKRPSQFSIFLYSIKGDNFVKPEQSGIMTFKVFYGGSEKVSTVTVEVISDGLVVTHSPTQMDISQGTHGLVTFMYKVPAGAKSGDVFKPIVKVIDKDNNNVIAKEDVLVA